ncbi:hypothetical protein C6501_05845 [Candidatus Poribacteria bacterium]|nr:MAG: hypothetical protein C6501_05845 [Candidatus Poribacteria bacterium]
MKCVLKCVCLCLIIFFPLKTQAELTGKVIFRYPGKGNELWVSDVNDISNARLLFRFEEYIIQYLSVQKDGPFIAVVAIDVPAKSVYDEVFLVNTNRLDAGARNLTDEQFQKISDVAISQNGDILFTNAARTDDKHGLYLIPKSEMYKPSPKITHLKTVDVHNAVWLPSGDQLAYAGTFGDVFLINIATREEFRVSRGGKYPAISPDGKKIAIAYKGQDFTKEIRVISLETLRPLKIIKDFVPHTTFGDLKWSPDGKYLVYTVFGSCLFKKCNTYHNIAIPLDGGPPERILDMFEHGVKMFDWVSTEGYAVEPTNRLTTLWGKLKK